MIHIYIYIERERERKREREREREREFYSMTFIYDNMIVFYHQIKTPIDF